MKSRDRFSGFALVLLFAGLLTAPIVAANSDFFFHGAAVEFADFAKDSIRVTSAKKGLELYGNYSRWGFSHPGPAFFYLFAAGEYVFHDWLRIIGSPYAAQMLTSILFQCVCVAAALIYALHRLDFLYALSAAMILLVVHWHYAVGAPASTWPPYLLFGPVFMMIVFGAGLANGDIKALPVLVFAGAMACHNHVAQPLIAVPLAALATAAWPFTNSAPQRTIWKAGLVAALISAIFLAPLALDLLKGRESNLATIWSHIRAHAGERHTLDQATGYLLSFPLYEQKQATLLASSTFSAFAYVQSNGRLVLLVIPAIAAVAAFVPLGRKQPYLRWFAIFALLATLLSFVWSIIQDGELHEFNGSFMYAVIFALYLLPLFVLSKIEPPVAPLRTAVAACTFVLLLAAIHVFPKSLHKWDLDAPQFIANLRNLVEKHHRIYIQFTQADEWIEALATINQLDRLGADFRVDGDNAYLHRYAAQDSAEDFAFLEASRTALMKIVGDADGIKIPQIRGPGMQFVFAESKLPEIVSGPIPLNEVVTRGLYPGAGYYAAGLLAQVLFLSRARETDTRLQLHMFAIGNGRRAPQRVIVRFDGHEVAQLDVAADTPQPVTIPAALWNAPRLHCLSLLVPYAQSDVALGKSPDRRRLGIAIRSIVVAE